MSDHHTIAADSKAQEPAGLMRRLFVWVRPFIGLYLALRVYHLIIFPFSLPGRTSLHFTEYPLLLAFFATWYFILKDSRHRAWIAALPIFFTYAVHDYYLWVFKRCPNLHEITKIEELFGILTPGPAFCLLLLLLSVAGVVLRMVDRRRLFSWRALVLAVWVIPFVGISTAPGEFYQYARNAYELKEWSALKNVQHQGRLFMAFVRAAEHLKNLHQLETNLGDIKDSDLYISPDEFPSFKPRNVHIVVMESFMDASLLKGVKFSRPPIHEDMQALLDLGRTTSVSPYFGGGTAESEFEILCGVHAFTWYQEFKLMTGAPTYCLPRILGEMGYATVSGHPFKQVMYNRDLAYKSLGFQDKYFLDAADPKKRLGVKSNTSRHVLDADVYDQTIGLLKERLKQNRPILNYLLTMEGHSPFHLDSVKQPVVVDVEPKHWLTEVLANKTYYRTKALAGYVQELMRLDPDSLIIAVADHLPPMTQHSGSFYEDWDYSAWEQGTTQVGLREQFLLAIDAGQVMTMPQINHYDIYRVVLNSLSDGEYCKHHTCWDTEGKEPLASLSEENYRNLLGMSMIEKQQN